MVLLDTHIFIFALQERLRADEAETLASDIWAISSISLWEIAWLAREGRISLGPDDLRVRRRLNEMTVYPIDLRVASALRRLDYSSDPADEIIGATCLVHDVPLVTRDMRMLRSGVLRLAV